MNPRLLDAFCSVGAASYGYAQAGWFVVGVDNNPYARRRYPFPLRMGDALQYIERTAHLYDAFAASPPCHDHSDLAHLTGPDGTGHLLTDTLALLDSIGKPYVVENVESPDAPEGAVMLCGSMFGLGTVCDDGQYRQLRRHRLFWSNADLSPPGPCAHEGQPIGVYGHGGGGQQSRGYKATASEARRALQTPWIRRPYLSQAVPPAYTTHLGKQLLEAL